MWACTAAVDREPQRGRAFSGQPSRRGAAHAAIALPHIAPSVDVRLESWICHPKVIRLVNLLVEAGLLSPDDSTSQGLGTVILGALRQWLCQIWGESEYLGFDAHLYDDAWSLFCMREPSDDPAFLSDCQQVLLGDVLKDHVVIALEIQARDDLLAKPGAEYLESLHPGLAWAVLGALERFGWQFGYCGAHFATDLTCNYMWCGMESEKEYCEEAGEDGEEYCGITRCDLDAQYPEQWCRGQKLDEAAFEVIQNSANADAKRIAAILGELYELGPTAESYCLNRLGEHFDWDMSLEANVLMTYTSHHLIFEVGDYAAQSMEMQAPAICAFVVPLDDPAWFAQMQQRWRPMARVGQLLHQLVDVFAKKQAEVEQRLC